MRQTYSLDSDYPTTWSDKEIDVNLKDVADAQFGDLSRFALIQQLMSSLDSTGFVAQDERDPLGSTDSVLSVLRAQGVDVDSLAERSKYMLSSTKFNPKLFLRAVHSNASYEDLKNAAEYLRQTIESQDSDMRTLVDTDYEHYVASKRMLDDVMQQFGDSGINETDDWGVSSVKHRIDEAASKYTVIQRPLEDANTKRQRYQNALVILDAYKYLFNLPSLLSKHAQNNDHDEFMRDLKQGLEQMQEMRGSQSADGARLSDMVGKLSNEIVEQYKAKLWKQLLDTPCDSNYSVYFTRLTDLGTDQPPVFVWLKHQIQQFLGQINDQFDRMALKTNLMAMYAIESYGYFEVTKFIKELPETPSGENLEGMCDTIETTEFWISLLEMFEELQATLERACAFFREYALLVQGRRLESHLRLTGDQEVAIRADSDKLVEVFNTRLIEFITAPTPKHLTLPVAAEHEASSGPRLSFLPPYTNSLSASKYLRKVLDILVPMQREIMELVNDNHQLNRSITTIRGQFIKAVSDCWCHDSQAFGTVQTWSSTGIQELKETPEYMKRFHAFIISQLRYLFGGESPDLVKSLMGVFPAALSLTIRSLHVVLVKSETSVVHNELLPAPISQDAKVLMAARNLYEIRDKTLPSLYATFKTSFRQDTGTIEESVSPVIEELSNSLFDLYTRKQKAKISQTISQEVPRRSKKWMEEETPRQISGFMYESLMLLVSVHSNLSENCPAIIFPVLNELYEHLLTCLLTAIRELDRLGKLGVLQLVADIEFVRSVMVNLRSEAAVKTIQRIYDTIRELSADRSLWEGTDSPRKYVLKVIETALKREYLVFACFRSIK